MDGWTDRQMDGCMNRWMEECMNSQMDGWMDGWTADCLISYSYSHHTHTVCTMGYTVSHQVFKKYANYSFIGIFF